MTQAIRTTCPYCGVGCGVLARRGAGGAIEISGDPDHPANRGRLCSKGAALGETLGLEGRLLQPRVNGTDTSWPEALDHVAQGFARVIEQHGPEAVAFYVSGQLLTEDYYVANKLMKGYIGTANIDTNSRLCMSSAVAGHKRAFGEDLVPISYEDLELAELIVLVGSNAAWCHPVLFQRILAAKEQRPQLQLVVIDPRRTPTCEFADLHLPIRSGSDVWLFNGLLAWLHERGISAANFVCDHTDGAAAALAAAYRDCGSVAAVADACGIDALLVERFYELFGRTERVVTMFSQGVNQSSAGTDKVNSIINCHLLTGRLGQAGMGPFSVTGQPNAMGGREVGGLANMLAAHMDLERPEHRATVQEFWRSPRIAQRPGHKAVDLFRAIHAGEIKAVWIMATNPAVSLPDAEYVRAALRRCELVVVSDCVADTDTNRLAHVLLPAAAWGEKDGSVTNSDRHISRQRAFQDAAGSSRPDWWIVAQVAQRMGYEGFAYHGAHEVFVEHAALSAYRNARERAFDIGGLASLTREQYDALEPIQWPVGAERHVKQSRSAPRLFKDRRFYHADGKARFVATVPRVPAVMPDSEYPLVLNTGRIRDQWHTMTRTGKAPRLTEHLVEPFVDVHPDDAHAAGLREHDLARVSTRWGAAILRVRASADTRRGMVFAPIHWSEAFASTARIGALVNPIVDPLSGEPELKHTPARVERFVVSWHGFVLTREQPRDPDVTWWSRSLGEGFMRYELAGRRVHGDWSRWARRWLGVVSSADWLEFSDPHRGTYRAALLREDRLHTSIFIAPYTSLPSRAWLGGLFAKDKLTRAERAGLLLGEPPAATEDPGPIVCSCFKIGRHTLARAIERQGLRTPAEIGTALRAGTNCGSCAGEIRQLIANANDRPAP